MIRIGVNGFGRIGRLLTRAIFELGYQNEMCVVAINGTSSVETLAHLYQFDSVHGIAKTSVRIIGDDVLEIGNHKIAILQQKDPKNINWAEHGVDVVMECTGKFLDAESASVHIKNGAKKVILSAPAKDKSVKTIVFGVNDTILTSNDEVISIGSCTTNCLAPLAYVLHNAFGIEKGFMTTIHAYTGDQNNVDGTHKDLRRARACGTSMVPTSTGAAKAIGLVIPELEGKLDGCAIRVPVANVSVVDLCFVSGSYTSAEEVNKVIMNAALGEMKGVLAYETRPLVSIDFVHNSNSSIFDGLETKVTGKNLVRVLSWYDNEWGFSCRMLDVAKLWMKK